MIKGAYIVSSVRTPVGKAKRGTLRQVRPDETGAVAVRGALDRVPGLEAGMVDDVLIGCAFPEAEQGMNVGRNIARLAGLPDSVPGATVNRFCSSGLQTIAMAAQAIACGQADIIVAGGAETMSLLPMGGHYFMPNPNLVETDPDVYLDMGNTAENVAEQYSVSRQEQDAFAYRSHQRAIDAITSCRFEQEIVTVPVREKIHEKGSTRLIEIDFKTDEGPRKDTSPEALASLKPVFRKGGTVTAGNASQMSDGAAASVVVSERVLAELGIDPIARLIGFAVAGVPPEIMGIAPVEAVPKVLKQVGLSINDIGLIELNEAFAAQAVPVIRELGLNEDLVNVNGGAIAMGHPLGCTGAKLTATLLHEMQRRQVHYGICTMCVGGGMAAAGIFENLML